MDGIKHRPASKESLIDMSDYKRMHSSSAPAYAPVSPWAMDDEKVRKVVAYRIAITAIEKNVPTKLGALRELEPRYIAMIRNNRSPEVQAHLKKVQRFGGPAAYYTGLIYRRFRLGMGSPALAQYYGCKPTGIRQTINRLCRIARALFPNPEDHLQWHHTSVQRALPTLKFGSAKARTFSYEQAYALWLSGLSPRAIGEQLGLPAYAIYNAVQVMRQKEKRPNSKFDGATAQRLRNKGYSLQNIADHFGLKSRTGVMMALRRYEARKCN
jgi:hypothetical protein